jgi:hypothetical protein
MRSRRHRRAFRRIKVGELQTLLIGKETGPFADVEVEAWHCITLVLTNAGVRSLFLIHSLQELRATCGNPPNPPLCRWAALPVFERHSRNPPSRQANRSSLSPIRAHATRLRWRN